MSLNTRVLTLHGSLRVLVLLTYKRNSNSWDSEPIGPTALCPIIGINETIIQTMIQMQIRIQIRIFNVNTNTKPQQNGRLKMAVTLLTYSNIFPIYSAPNITPGRSEFLRLTPAYISASGSRLPRCPLLSSPIVSESLIRL